jgi:hypothetical protein
MRSHGGENDRRKGGIDMGKKEDLRQTRADAAEVCRQLAALDKMTTGELAERYREVFGFPTKTRHKAYLRKRVAWRIQELAEGGLSERALARIEELAPLAPVRWRDPQPSGNGIAMAVGAPTPPKPRDPRLPAAGTVLVRVHKGAEHRVTVLEDGFEYGCDRFRTLSQVARQISGTPWNGFLFFGLQRRTRAAKSEPQG